MGEVKMFQSMGIQTAYETSENCAAAQQFIMQHSMPEVKHIWKDCETQIAAKGECVLCAATTCESVCGVDTPVHIRITGFPCTSFRWFQRRDGMMERPRPLTMKDIRRTSA